MTVQTADPPPLVVDLFAGPGGWDVGLGMLGQDLRVVGIEWDRWACRTGHAAGHVRVQADVARLNPSGMAGAHLLIASPPCQAWSRSGKRKGILDQPAIFAHAMRVIAAAEWIDYADAGPLPMGEGDEGGTWHDARSPLVLEVIRWVMAVQPANICLEQVPDVLPFWELIARWLRGQGYAVWAGCLSSERYGVPQTRERAIVVASRERAVSAPTATHTAYDSRLADGGKWHGTDGDLFGAGLEPWVSMAEALGLGMTARPSTTVVTGANGGGPDPMSGGSGTRAIHRREREEGRWIVNTRGDRQTPGGNEFDATDRPSWALTEKTRSWTVRTSLGTPKIDGRNGTHELDPFQRPAHVVTTTVGEWSYERPDGMVAGAQKNATARPIDHPAATLLASMDNGDTRWVHERPATTVQFEGASVRVTVQEAAVLQSFPPDYPWQGTKSAQFRQVGDAVPVLLAMHVLAECLGIPVPAVKSGRVA